MFKKILILTICISALALMLSFALPAKAFYLEVPQALKNLVKSLKASQITAQEEPVISPAPAPSEPVPAPSPVVEPAPQPSTPSEQTMGPSEPAKQTCNVNGVEMPGPCSNYEQGKMESYSQEGQMMGPSPEDQERQERMEKQNRERQLRDMQRSTKDMSRGLKDFERMVQKTEKMGGAVPAEIKEQVEKVKGMIDKIKSATSPEELQDIDMGEIGDIMQSMEEYRREVFEAQQRLQGIKRGLKGMEQGIRMFEKQIARITKQGLPVPPEVQEKLTAIKSMIEAIKNAKSWKDIEELDLDSIGDMMQGLDESRQQLEMLARWPQTVKDMKRELTNLTRELKKAKSIVDRLIKQDIDLTGYYSAFEDAINKLKAVKEEAESRVKAGDAQGAFELVESDFFGQMEDVWQNHKIIMTMSNLGRFKSEFQQGIKQSEQLIRQLKKAKKDTSELEEILSQAKQKGQEVLDLIKTKDFDKDYVMELLDELENLRQAFDDIVDELTGRPILMSWEQGPQQFKKVEMPKEFYQYMPKKAQNEVPAEQTCNINGVEMPGPCEKYRTNETVPAPSNL